MAHTKSAKKRARQNVERQLRNRRRKTAIKRSVRAFDEAVSAGRADEAAEVLKKVHKQLDSTAAKNVVHKRAAARKKSRLAKRLNQLATK